VSLLPWVLLATTITVRVLFARLSRWGWWLDLGTVPLWLVYYAAHGDWPLLGVPLLFAWIDLKAVSFWRRRE
jgi:hypothetical protein